MLEPVWQRKVIFAHLEEPPFCFRADDGRASGCDVELAETILTRIGVKEFEPVLAEFSDLLPGVVDGRWMMTTGLFVTVERCEVVEFSRPIWALPDGLLVRAGNPKRLTGYASVAANRHTKLGVVKKQVQRDTARRAGIPVERIAEYVTQDEAARAVVSGEIDAYASVAMAHRGYLQRRPHFGLMVVNVDPSDETAEDYTPYFGAFAFSKSNGGLASAVNLALASYLGSADHRALMAPYGFTDDEIDRVTMGTD